jgi:hypothetical protein
MDDQVKGFKEWVMGGVERTPLINVLLGISDSLLPVTLIQLRCALRGIGLEPLPEILKSSGDMLLGGGEFLW